MNHSRQTESLQGTQLGHCGDDCISRRVLGYLGTPMAVGECAVEHYETLGDPEMAEWLLSVKERVHRLEEGSTEE